MAGFSGGQRTPYFSGQPVESEKSGTSKVFGAAALFAGSAAIFSAGFIPFRGGNLFDVAYKAGKVAGVASPFGIVSSLRVPEIISPFTSAGFQSSGKGHVDFAEEFLSHTDTRKYMAAQLGTTERHLSNLGVGSGSSMRFKRHAGFAGMWGRGTMSVIGQDGTETAISDTVMLTERTFSSAEDFAPRTNANQFAEAVITSTDHTLDPKAVLAGRNGAHKYIPVASVHGPVGSFGDLWKRVTYGRAYAAFEAQRLPNAVRTIGESIPIVGDLARRFLPNGLDIVKKGGAIRTWGGIIGLTAKVAVAGAAVSEYNWAMRYKGEDNLAVRESLYGLSSVAIGASVAYGHVARTAGRGLTFSQKIRMANPVLAATVGIASFIGQNVLPGFDKGVYAGASNTFEAANSLRARVGEVTGSSSLKRWLDNTFPGSTDFSTSIATGFAAFGLYAGYHIKEGRYFQFGRNYEGLSGTTGFMANARAASASPLQALDHAYKAWEKVSYNLEAADDLDAFQRMGKVAFKAANPGWEEVPGKMAEDALNARLTSSARGGLAGASFGDKLHAVANHLGASSHNKFRGISGAIATFGLGLLGHMVATGSVLGSTETPEDLQRIASGEKLVAVRKSRWWGAGGNPYEGGKISYYRPSFNALLTSDAENRAVWGDEVETRDPISRYILENTSTYLEEKNYYDRPYPITSPGFANTPLAGGVLGATIGRVLKPAQLMHVGEWSQMGENGPEYLNVPKGIDSNPSLALGGTGVGIPQSPYDTGAVLGELQYNLREAQGLTGFVKNQIQKAVTGQETYSSGQPTLAESGDMYSLRNSFWNLELGGMASMTEIPRRFLARERAETRNRYNPIRNNMPSWMPEDFKTGDQYSQLASGNSRLPGAGYAATRPELKGVDPENYPDWFKYQILGGIAPYSDEFRRVKMNLYSQRKKGLLNDDINRFIDETDEQIESQRFKRNYFVESASQRQDSDTIKFLRNSYMSSIETARSVAAPVEYLTFGGIRPFQKFLPAGDVLSDYKKYAVYGSETSFWDFLDPNTVRRDYLGPAAASVMDLMPFMGSTLPGGVVQQRDTQQYFDRLNYMKYMKLAMDAKASGNGRGASEYERQAHKTVYGVNPYGNALSIYGALPAAEKDRYEGFARMQDPGDRQELIGLLPGDQKHLFEAIWAKRDGKEPAWRTNQGMPDTFRAEYQTSGAKGMVGYADFARMKELEQYFAGQPMPEEDWIGWRDDVDINDIKIKYLQENGLNTFDYGIYPSQVAMLKQKPYLDGATEDLNYRHPGMITSFLTQGFGAGNVRPMQWHAQPDTTGFAEGSSVTYVNDDREEDIRKGLKRYRED